MTWSNEDDTVRMYADGVEYCNDPGSGTVSVDASSDMIAGSAASGYSTPGYLDEIRVYNYVRTPEQIIQDMNAGHPAPGSPIGSANLHLKFDEGYGDTANDSSPHGNNGTLGTGDSSPSWTMDGKFGKALDYDNSNDYVDMGDIIDLSGSDDLTLAGWFNRDTADSDDTILAKRNGIAPGDTGYIVYLDDANDTLIFEISDGTDEYQLESSSTFTATGWNHFTVVWDEDSASASEIYINGKDDNATDTGTIANIDAVNSGNLRIGTETDSGNPFDGKIDDIRIYNFALSESQAKTLYAGGSTQVLGAISTDGTGPASNAASAAYCPPGDSASCNPPIGEWSLNEKTGSTAYDISENSNNGTFSGNTSWKRSCAKGACIRLDGTNDWVDMGSPTNLDNMSTWTYEAWIYPITFQASQSTWYMGKASFDSGEKALGTDNTGDGEVRCVYEGDTGQVRERITNELLPKEEWSHVVCTVDPSASTDFHIYINGVEASYSSTANGTSPDDDDTENFRLGANHDGSQDFNGLIDEVKVYDYVRTPAQIAWGYNRGKPIGYWKLDECSGTTAYDSGSQGNNGTITIGAEGDNSSAGTCSGSSGEAWYEGAAGKYSASLDFDNSDDYVTIGDLTLLEAGDDEDY